jgi:hypothetical protein
MMMKKMRKVVELNGTDVNPAGMNWHNLEEMLH